MRLILGFLFVCWFVPTAPANSPDRDPFFTVAHCPWLIQKTVPRLSESTTQAIAATGGVKALREVLWKNLGKVGEKQEFDLESESYDLARFDSPALASMLPGSNHLLLLRARIDGNPVPIGLLVSYGGPVPDALFVEHWISDAPPVPNYVIYPLDQAVYPSEQEDAEIHRRLKQVLTNRLSYFYRFRGNAVNFSVAAPLVQWNIMHKLDSVFPDELQLPTVGHAFPPNNNYTGEVIKHARDRGLVRANEQALVMGAGSGGDSIALAKLGMKVTAVDIDPWAKPSVALAAHLTGLTNEIRFIEGSLFDQVRDSYSLITFVAPYPTTNKKDATQNWRTFSYAYDLLLKFLVGVPYHLNPGGSVVFLSQEPPLGFTPNWLDLKSTNLFSETVVYQGKVHNFGHATYEMKLNDQGLQVRRQGK